MSSPEIRLSYRSSIKDLSITIIHAIFFPLFAAWRWWKLHMASKKEILDDLSRYREKSDQLMDDIFSMSDKSLEIMAEVERLLGHDEKHQELRAKIQKYGEVVLTSVTHVNEYSTSLMTDYRSAIRKIGNSSDS
ncbi:hypothetical protein ID853_18170 [Xenorhabdus sp. Vera]|uniref:hypothetical protein n=1 Tax=Xenorhabdus koppenhoeferi TaxID=351659 RepID=UPI001983C629|nr:hypothetical protein [Xenorhabdus sp. Vera]MBD2812744.1 hypothetical protein [Xenorhabdus sp. Vera]